MHEISLVRSMFGLLEETYPDQVNQIRSIHLSVGLLSNVQPILMQNAFEAVQEELPQYQQIKLKVEVLPILIKCESCGSITEVKDYYFVCSCGIPGKNIIQGEEMMISKVEFEGD